MGMKFDADLGLGKVLQKGKTMLGRNGPVQIFIDSTVLKGVAPYVPMRSGALTKSAALHSKIGQGLIIWKGPQARLLYYNVVYIDPIYKAAGFLVAPKGSPKGTPKEKWISRKGVSKVPSDLKRHAGGFKFDKSRHENAGAHWAERYTNDHLKELAAAVNRKTGEEWNS